SCSILREHCEPWLRGSSGRKERWSGASGAAGMSVGKVTRRMSLSAAVVCVACASNHTPKGWLPKPREAQESAYGGWIELTYLDGEQRRSSSGELIAVSSDSVWVLTEEKGLVIPTAVVRKGKLTGYAAQNLTTWVIGGTLSTASNGAFFIFTMP